MTSLLRSISAGRSPSFPTDVTVGGRAAGGGRRLGGLRRSGRRRRSSGILSSHGTDSERVTEALSQRGLIRPSTTQGHIGDITRSDIVFDAPTTQGGSGGPIFNKNGHVIAVEYAVLPKFGGNSFGVPITYALEMLDPRRGGRKKPAA